MTDLSELMSRDPMSLSRDPAALDEIIMILRKQRANYTLGARTAGKAAKPKVEAIDLDALGISFNPK